MTRETIIDTINDFLVEEFEVDATVIQSGANLKESLDLDSLDYVDLVVIIESNFGVKLEGKDFATINTFEDLYNVVEQKFHALA